MTDLELTKAFGLNLEKERDALGLSQQEMADKLLLSLSTYRRLVAGETSKIEIGLIYRIYKLTGKYVGEMVNTLTDEILAMQRYRELSESQKTYVKGLIEFENRFRLDHADFEDYITVYIPTGDMKDGMIYDSAHVEKVNIGKYRQKYGNRIHFGIKITSNHLHPVYNLGDILLIAKEPIRDGDTGIFFNREDGRLYIRKFYQTKPCLLEPVNDYGMVFEVNPRDLDDMDKWVKFGRVVTKCR